MERVRFRFEARPEVLNSHGSGKENLNVAIMQPKLVELANGAFRLLHASNKHGHSPRRSTVTFERRRPMILSHDIHGDPLLTRENTPGAWGQLIARSRTHGMPGSSLADVSLSSYGTEENKGSGETPRISEPKSQITPFRPLLLGNGPARKSRTYRKAIYKRCNLGAPVFRPIPYGLFRSTGRCWSRARRGSYETFTTH
jgi:hypothetical protein